MSEIYRYRFVWSGLSGLPGVTTMYGADDTLINAAAKTFFTAFGANFPSNTTITFPSSVDILDDITGDFTATSVPDTVPTPLTIGSNAAWNPSEGLVVHWKTSGVVNSHRVTGSTYIVPMFVAGPSGAPIASIRTSVITAAAAFVTACSGKLRVWSRPVAAKTAIEHPPHGLTARDGSSYPVIASSVPNKIVVLRSRRD